MYGISEVHFAERLMSDMKYNLKFYMTSMSNNILNEKEYDCLGSFLVVGRYYVVISQEYKVTDNISQEYNGLLFS